MRLEIPVWDRPPDEQGGLQGCLPSPRGQVLSHLLTITMTVIIVDFEDDDGVSGANPGGQVRQRRPYGREDRQKSTLHSIIIAAASENTFST